MDDKIIATFCLCDDLLKAMHHQDSRFALCLNNEGYPASLEIGKLYRVVPDEEAAAHGYIRIIAESGEDYALPVLSLL